MNLHKEHGKPLVQRVIDQLVAQEIGRMKNEINYFFYSDILENMNLLLQSWNVHRSYSYVCFIEIGSYL